MRVFYKQDKRKVCDAGDSICLTDERLVMRKILYA